MRLALACVLVVASAGGCSASSKRSSPPPNGATTAQTGSAGIDVRAVSPRGDGLYMTDPLPPGCKRQRKTFVYNCTGMPPGDGESNTSPATVCDDCLGNADCTDKPGGECLSVGDQMCTGPAHFVCKYPDPACGNKICPEPIVSPPP